MDSGIPRKGFTKASIAATAATLILSAGWSTVAQGATESVVRCDREVRALTSLDVSAIALSVNTVDHVTSDPEPASLKTQSDINDGQAPLLYLTPRVADLLRDVFQTTEREIPLTATVDMPSSPLAHSVDEKVSSEQNDDNSPASGADEEILPRYQQQMYREDI